MSIHIGYNYNAYGYRIEIYSETGVTHTYEAGNSRYEAQGYLPAGGDGTESRSTLRKYALISAKGFADEMGVPYSHIHYEKDMDLSILAAMAGDEVTA